MVLGVFSVAPDPRRFIRRTRRMPQGRIQGPFLPLGDPSSETLLRKNDDCFTHSLLWGPSQDELGNPWVRPELFLPTTPWCNVNLLFRILPGVLPGGSYYRIPSQNGKIPRWTGGSGPPGGPKINDFRSEKSKTSDKFLKFLFGGNGPSGNHVKIIFRWSGSSISEVSQFLFVILWPS